MNELRQKVRRIKLELNLSDRELSKRLGKSPTYLSKIFEVGISTARQKALSDELDMVVKGHKFISAAERLEIVNKQSEHNRNCATKYLNRVNDLKQELSEKNSEIEELQADFDEYLGKYDECFTQLSQQKEKNEVLKIEKESILSVLGPEIKNLKSMLDKVDSVNDELREQLGLKNRNALIQNIEIKKLRQSQKIHRLLSLVCLATIILLIVIQWGV